MSEEQKQIPDQNKDQVIVPEVAGKEEDNSYRAKTPAEKGIWIALLLFSIFWLFFPEPTDVVPILGWIDEGFAGILLLKSLASLNIKIPFLDKFIAMRLGKRS